MAERVTKKMIEAELISFKEAAEICSSNIETLLKTNARLIRELKQARAMASRMTKAAIYYDETYSRLSPEAKAEFDRVGQQVYKNLDKEYNLGGNDNAYNELQQDEDCRRIS